MTEGTLLAERCQECLCPLCHAYEDGPVCPSCHGEGIGVRVREAAQNSGDERD